MKSATVAAADARWLLLIHHIPPKPSYFRAKVGRRLQRIGAVALKNAVYVLPHAEQPQEDMQWIAREIIAEGGEATLCAASLVDGLRDEQVEALFQAAREADYAQIAEEARQIAAETPSKVRQDDPRRAERQADVARLKKRLTEVSGIDFFGAAGRETAEAALSSLEKRLADTPKARAATRSARPEREAYQGRTWVTRKNVHVDRIASAWLVRRFVDPKATFKFVPGQGYVAKRDEVTFDMFEAEFTHIGDRCTFEVLVEQFALDDAALSSIAEIVHDIDVKDGKFARMEAAGVASLIAGLALLHRDDEKRLELGRSVFDALHELYRARRADRRSAERSKTS